MKKQVRNYIASAMLLLPAAGAIVMLPSSALAQPATPEISSFDAEADAGVRPGSRFTFRLVGTPRVQASVRIRGVPQIIALRETTPGVYVGRYTLKNTDRVASDAEVRAALRRGNRTTAANYALSDMIAPPVVAAPPPPPPVVRAPEPRIERFGMVPIERIEPGADLQFAVEGVPGATVSIDLPGVERDLRLRETRPGHYEGSYTIRRGDDFNPNRPLIASLRLGDRVVNANLNIAIARPGADIRPPAGGDNRPPVLVNLTPRDGDSVAGGPPVLISGGFDDHGGSGVDPASVRIIVSGRNVTPEAQINRQSFSFRGVLPPGRHTVDVTARDMAGNTVRTGWDFDVVAAAPASAEIRILNQSNNGQVGSGPTTVQGRTAPNASVVVKVVAAAPLGGIVNITQELFSQTLQADAAGNFSFTFTPQIALPGTRYDISMVATRGNLRDDARLVLIQR